MTKRQFNQIERISDRLDQIREVLPKDDMAREYLWRAATALSEMLAYTVPNPR